MEIKIIKEAIKGMADDVEIYVLMDREYLNIDRVSTIKNHVDGTVSLEIEVSK